MLENQRLCLTVSSRLIAGRVTWCYQEVTQTCLRFCCPVNIGFGVSYRCLWSRVSSMQVRRLTIGDFWCVGWCVGLLCFQLKGWCALWDLQLNKRLPRDSLISFISPKCLNLRFCREQEQLFGFYCIRAGEYHGTCWIAPKQPEWGYCGFKCYL